MWHALNMTYNRGIRGQHLAAIAKKKLWVQTIQGTLTEELKMLSVFYFFQNLNKKCKAV